MIKLFKLYIKKLAQFFRFDVRAYDFRRIHELRKQKIMRDLAINLLIDGGANEGQFCCHIINGGYTGRIVSIEPLPEIFAKLNKLMGKKSKWHGLACGLGDIECTMDIHVASNSQVSSLLAATGVASTGNWHGYRKEQVAIRRLDGILNQFAKLEDKIYLKLDVQGYENKVLNGLGKWRDKMAVIEIEASTIELYKGETLFYDLASSLANNYSLYSMNEVLVDYRTGRLLQIEMLFVNNAYL